MYISLVINYFRFPCQGWKILTRNLSERNAVKKIWASWSYKCKVFKGCKFLMKNSVLLGKYNSSTIQEKYGVNKWLLVELILSLGIHNVFLSFLKRNCKSPKQGFSRDHDNVQHPVGMKTLWFTPYNLQNAFIEFSPVKLAGYRQDILNKNKCFM